MRAHSVLKTALLAGAFIVGDVICPRGAAAQVADDTYWACFWDAFRLCSAYIPNEEQITHCMTVKWAQVSSSCQAAMEREDRIERRINAHHRRTERYLIEPEPAKSGKSFTPSKRKFEPMRRQANRNLPAQAPLLFHVCAGGLDDRRPFVELRFDELSGRLRR
jgi:hypothetical protein